MKNFGLLYVATGEKYIKECIESAKSAKSVMPDVSITLYTDIHLENDLFDYIEQIENPRHSFFDKILPLQETKYEKTLFIDTDTFFVSDVYDISILLDTFDMAVAHAPWRLPPWAGWEAHDFAEIPISFPELNTGVIAYRNTANVKALIRQWGKIYEDQLKWQIPPKNDQPAFRHALYFSGLKINILPPEYNFRTVFKAFKGGGIKVKILHGRSPSLNNAIKMVNKNDGINIFDFNK